MKKSRFLAYALAISLALNASFSLALWKRLARSKPASVKTAIGSLAETLSAYVDLSLEELFSRLGSMTLVAEGYVHSDLALAVLVARHSFDLERALGALPPQQRRIALMRDGETVALTLYPGLSEHDHLEIAHFAKTEVWPLTAEGLFAAWPHHQGERSLREAIALTGEYRHAQALLATKGIFLERDELLAFLSDVAKPSLVKKHPLTQEGCDAFLIEALREESQMAASLLIDYNKGEVLRALSDEDVLTMLDLVIDHPSIELVAKNFLCSLRSDAVRQGAAEVLYTLAELPMPHPYDHQEALRRFLPSFFTPKVVHDRTHVVEEGDTLWHIARRYKVDVEVLKRENGLDSEFALRPGMVLIIPEQHILP